MSAYKDRCDKALEGLEHVSTGIARDCADCDTVGLTDDEMQERYAMGDEGGFSWQPCDMCGGIAGQRYAVHGFMSTPTGEVLVHLDVCEDCIMYVEYGDEPEGR